SSHSRTAARHSPSFVTSAVTQIPAEASQASTSCACSGLWTKAAMRAPSPMKARAIAAPIPCLAPLTSTTSPSNARPDRLVSESCILGMMGNQAARRSARKTLYVRDQARQWLVAECRIDVEDRSALQVVVGGDRMLF